MGSAREGCRGQLVTVGLAFDFVGRRRFGLARRGVHVCGPRRTAKRGEARLRLSLVKEDFAAVVVTQVMIDHTDSTTWWPSMPRTHFPWPCSGSTRSPPSGSNVALGSPRSPRPSPAEQADTPHASRVPPTRRDTADGSWAPRECVSNANARRQQERRRQREQGRRSAPPAPPTSTSTSADEGRLPADHRRAAATECGWCLGPLQPKSRGPVPKWCSASCRQRAWEQRRAAASGLSAIEVVERIVEVPAPRVDPPKPRNQQWRAVLRELTRQLEEGLVYDRHLVGIGDEVRQVHQALRRRGTWGDVVTSTSPRTPRVKPPTIR